MRQLKIYKLFLFLFCWLTFFFCFCWLLLHTLFNYVAVNRDSSSSSSYIPHISGGDSQIRGPNLFLLGVQKGGSSNLYKLLKQEYAGLLFGGQTKEPNFFGDANLFEINSRFYEVHFSSQSYLFNSPHSSALRGGERGRRGSKNANIKNIINPFYYLDASTYMHNADVVVPRMLQFFSQEERERLKFIVMLREPVRRDVSMYNHNVRNFLAKTAGGGNFAYLKSFNESGFALLNKVVETRTTLADPLLGHLLLLNANNNKLVARGFSGNYATQIRVFLKHFRRDQILILSSEAAFKDPTNVLKSIHHFLFSPHDPSAEDEENAETKAGDSGEGVLAFPAEDHSNLVNRKCVLAHVPKLDCAFRDLLAAYYRPYNQELMELLNATRAKAHPSEPPFAPFPEPSESMACVADARLELDALLAREAKTRKDKYAMSKKQQQANNRYSSISSDTAAKRAIREQVHMLAGNEKIILSCNSIKEFEREMKQ